VINKVMLPSELLLRLSRSAGGVIRSPFLRAGPVCESVCGRTPQVLGCRNGQSGGGVAREARGMEPEEGWRCPPSLTPGCGARHTPHLRRSKAKTARKLYRSCRSYPHQRRCRADVLQEAYVRIGENGRPIRSRQGLRWPGWRPSHASRASTRCGDAPPLSPRGSPRALNRSEEIRPASARERSEVPNGAGQLLKACVRETRGRVAAIIGPSREALAKRFWAGTVPTIRPASIAALASSGTDSSS